MKLWRRVIDFVLRRNVAESQLPSTAQVVREARQTRRDLHELRRLEVIVRRR